MNFDGAKHFGYVASVIAAGTLLSIPALGCWPVAGAAVALYYLLVFFNALEQRDINDATRQQSDYQRRKRLSWAALRGGPAFLLFSYADFESRPIGGHRSSVGRCDRSG